MALIMMTVKGLIEDEDYDELMVMFVIIVMRRKVTDPTRIAQKMIIDE